MEISYTTFFRIIIIVLYLVIGTAAFRWFFPRFTWAYKRVAILLLVAQVVAIGWSVVFPPSSSFEAWIWHVDREWNIPSTLASTQLALVALTALITAWHARSLPAWQRLYYVALAAVFFYLAYDEYAVEHEFLFGWFQIYIMLGITVALGTLAVAWQSPWQARKWHLLLLAGLATSAFGAFVVEAPSVFNFTAIIPYIDSRSWLEETLEFAGIWLALVALLGHLSAVSTRPAIRLRTFFGFTLLWLFFLSQSRSIHPIAYYADGSQSANVVFEGGQTLRGYLLENNKKHIHLFLSPGQRDFQGQSLSGLGYSIHLVDQVSGESIISRDEAAHRMYFLLTPGYTPVYRQWVDIGKPAAAQDNRAYWIVLTLWHGESGEYTPQEILSSDHQLLGNTQVVLGEKVWRERSPSASTIPLAVFDNGFTLDSWEAPDSSRPGESLTLEFSWRSEADGAEDHSQFLHLGHTESGDWWVYDQQPLGDRLPTRLWYSGLADSEIWQVPLPADLAPGRYTVFSGLYRSRDKERVPASDADGGYFLDARVPLGSLIIE